MICVSVMYPHAPGKHFDHEYYEQKHRPLVMNRLASHGIIRYEIQQGFRMPSAASLSRTGVRISALPAQPSAQGP